MWNWELGRRLPVQEAPAELGAVTLSGDPVGVLLGGERRWVPVYGPGGYCWRPEEGQNVLVLKAGGEGESPCVLGAMQSAAELEPGEVQINGGNSSIRLGHGGLELKGTVMVNGQELEQYIRSIASEMFSGGET